MLGSSSLNAIRLNRLPAPRTTGSMAIKLSSWGRPVSFEITPIRIRPRGPGNPPSEGNPNTTPSFRPQIRGAPGAPGRIQSDAADASDLATAAQQRIQTNKRNQRSDRAPLHEKWHTQFQAAVPLHGIGWLVIIGRNIVPHYETIQKPKIVH